jgi:hypothetical protein
MEHQSGGFTRHKQAILQKVQRSSSISLGFGENPSKGK